MKEPQQQQTLQTDDEATIVVGGEEATRVSPRFDDEETLVARPVVPLTETPETPPPATAATRAARAAYARRPSWPLALMLVSVLIGGVLGGAGLYLYQRQSGDDAAAPAQPETTAAEAPRPSDAASAQTEPAPAEAPAADAQTSEPAPDDSDKDDAEPERKVESTPAAERRDSPAGDGGAGTPKRGKKGEREEEVKRRARPRDDGPVADSPEPEARRVDTIFYRQRRAERRAERQAARRARRDAAQTDRLRRIFEGTPE